MIKELREKVEELLNHPKDDTDRIKLSLIKKILSDNNCFFKMNIDDALNILKDLRYNKDEAFEIYKKLISPDEYLKFKEEI